MPYESPPPSRSPPLLSKRHDRRAPRRAARRHGPAVARASPRAAHPLRREPRLQLARGVWGWVVLIDWLRDVARVALDPFKQPSYVIRLAHARQHSLEVSRASVTVSQQSSRVSCRAHTTWLARGARRRAARRGDRKERHLDRERAAAARAKERGARHARLPRCRLLRRGRRAAPRHLAPACRAQGEAQSANSPVFEVPSRRQRHRRESVVVEACRRLRPTLPSSGNRRGIVRTNSVARRTAFPSSGLVPLPVGGLRESAPTPHRRLAREDFGCAGNDGGVAGTNPTLRRSRARAALDARRGTVVRVHGDGSVDLMLDGGGVRHRLPPSHLERDVVRRVLGVA